MSMLRKIENELITIQVNDMGAELTHLIDKESSLDYMWSGDEAYWTGRSPVLFPIIGSLNEGSCLVDGKRYTMANHGFARRSYFNLIEESENSLTYALSDNEHTRAQYPFKFNLQLNYELVDRRVIIRYTIINKSDKMMPFQIGTHPAFRCPTGNTSMFDQWFLELEKEEVLKTIGLKDNLLLLDQVTEVLNEGKILGLSHEPFYKGAYVFKDVKSSYVTLKSEQTDVFVKVSFEGLPDLAIWQPPNAPFICIEPWYGHGDPYGLKVIYMRNPE